MDFAQGKYTTGSGKTDSHIATLHPLTRDGNGRLVQVDVMITSTLGVGADLVGIPDVDVEGVESFSTTVLAVKDDHSVDIGDRKYTMAP